MMEAASKATLNFNDIYRMMVKKMPGKTVNRKDPRDLEGAERIRIIPYRGAKSVVFRCKVMSSTRRKKYNVVIQFLDVEFAPANTKQVPVGSEWTFVEYEGAKYYFKKPSFFKNPVRIRCSCPDFKQRFAWPDRAAKCLAGGPPAQYRRKTPPPPKGRPYVNPDNVPGMCYHIYRVAKDLEKWTTLMR